MQRSRHGERIHAGRNRKIKVQGILLIEDSYARLQIVAVKVFQCVRYADEIKLISEDTGLLKELNECYAKQTNHQKQKIHEMHSLYEQKVETMSFDNNRLHEEHIASRTELSNLQGKHDVLLKEYEKLQSDNTRTMPVDVHNAAVEECKELLEKLKRQYETEKEKLSARVRETEQLHCHDKTQLDVITTERDQLKASNKNFEKSLKYVYFDCVDFFHTNFIHTRILIVPRYAIILLSSTRGRLFEKSRTQVRCIVQDRFTA